MYHRPTRPRFAAFLSACLLALCFAAHAQTTLRPPAVPLVTHDPYFSVWSFNDKLTDNWSRHWTGAIQAMCGMVYIDKRPYRFAGPMPDIVPAMEQKSLVLTPTSTVYTFEANGIQLVVTFLSPLLANDLRTLGQSVTYVTFETRATDRRPHSVRLYFDATGEWAVNTPNQRVWWQHTPASHSYNLMMIGTDEQPILAKKGDNLRIDWGYFLVVVPQKQGTVDTAIVSDRDARDSFARDGVIPAKDDGRMPRPASDNWPVLATSFDLGRVTGEPIRRRLSLAYEDIRSIELMRKQLKPFRAAYLTNLPERAGTAGLLPIVQGDRSVESAVQWTQEEFDTVTRKCRDFDRELIADLTRVGGKDYADLCILAYRQALAAHKLVAGPNGEPLHFSKENFSNGCIATVDVIYPAAPMFLLLNPGLLKAQLTPVLDYAASGRWKFPFAPHDLGTYPLANGQVYGGGETNERDQMPVEESGNMLIMLAALAKVDGNANYARKWWPQVTQWAEYLKAKGMDPENQLCTDDFAGHLAHNTNLSLKAIVALGSYSQLCQKLGKTDEARQYRATAQEMATKWIEMAKDGDHYRLTFDRPGTWSQKYNLVWDKLLDLNLFPPDVARTEIAYYKKMQNAYGLPLDNRSKYTKLDWIVWTATMAESKEDFQAFISPLVKFANDTPNRVPLTDWFFTDNAKQAGFQARSVVGGVFIKMLSDPAMWKKWSSRAK
jgi:hypothetical protein